MTHKLKEYEQDIIGQAIAEIETEDDVPTVRCKVLGTFVGLDKKSMEVFDMLVRKKRIAGLIADGKKKHDV